MNTIYRIMLLFAVLTLASCKEESDVNGVKIIYEEEKEGLDEFKAFSLAPYGINALIYLPDETSDVGAADEPRVEHEPNGYKWDIYLGQNFHLIIDDWGDENMIAAHKEELEDYSFMYKVDYLEDKENFLLYTKKLTVDGKKDADPNVGIEHSGYYCYGQHTIEGINFVFRSGDTGSPKLIADYIAKSILSVEEIKKDDIN